MIRTKMLADGVMEIRLIGDDGELDAIVELTRPTFHSLYVAHLLVAQDEIREAESSALVGCGVVLAFPQRDRSESAAASA
jgi:hypothetical protein